MSTKFGLINLATLISNKATSGVVPSGTKRKETVREGEDIELLCAVDANPAATDVLWMYEVGAKARFHRLIDNLSELSVFNNLFCVSRYQ